MESTKLIEEKLGKYPSCNEYHNFVAESEITVTITLDEYRALVTTKAVGDRELSKRNEQIYDLQKKVRELEEKAKELEGKLVEAVIDKGAKAVNE